MEPIKHTLRALIIIVVDFLIIVFFSIVLDSFLLPYGLPFIDLFTIILFFTFIRLLKDFKIYSSNEINSRLDDDFKLDKAMNRFLLSRFIFFIKAWIFIGLFTLLSYFVQFIL